MAIKIAGDVPVASKTVPLSDVVSVSKASYDGSGLTVSATSSDPAVDLTVVGYGPLAGGNAVFGGVTGPLDAPKLTFAAPAGQYEFSLVAIGGRVGALLSPYRYGSLWRTSSQRGPARRRRCSQGPT